MKKIFIVLFLFFLLFFNKSSEINQIEKKDKEKIGELIINKINLKQDLYKIESKKNNIEENVTIMKESNYPDIANGILILAAHSGTGKIAYFEELDNLELKDNIIIKYNNRKYIYQITKIWEQEKNGYIKIKKENKKQLILTTCSPKKKNTQLIINCIEKEFN